MTKFKRPKLHRTFRGTIKSILSHWTVTVWILVIAGAVMMYAHGAYLSGMSGIVESINEPVAPVETARLVAVHVKPGDRVKAGQLIATLDTSLLDAQAALDEASLLDTEVAVSREQQGLLQVERQFQLALRDAETALETEKLNRGRDAAELEALRKELTRREELLAKRLISEIEVADLRPRIAALDRAEAAYPAVIKTIEDRAADARRELEMVQRWMQGGGTTNTDAAITKRIEDRRKMLLASRQLYRLQKDAYQLRSGGEGVVAEVLFTPGVTVPAGAPVARIVYDLTDHVSGFLPETHLHAVKEGDRMLVIPRGERSKLIFKSTVESVSPEVAAMPGRFSPIRNQPIRGRRVILKLDSDSDLLPGETVDIRGEETMWARWTRLWQMFRPAGAAKPAPAA